VIGLGAGTGVTLVTVLLQVLRPEAAPLVEGILRWGPLFVIVLAGMELLHSTINTWGRQLVGAMTDNAKASGSNAVAMQSMADAMQRISQHEDERDRERELAMDHMAYTMQEVLTEVKDLKSRFPEKSLSQVAGGTH
jgi:hypothetical protein